MAILSQSSVRSSVLQAERSPIKGRALEIKRFVPQAEHPGKRNLWEELFDDKPQIKHDQDACMWRCQEWCNDQCRNSDDEEDCLDSCLYGNHWWRCIRECKNGDLDRPGKQSQEEDEKEEVVNYRKLRS